ncbi:hypothetical protein [Bacillus alkalicellulosilyticus]|uniref:hypothetical protein n=1 Tax=Alkalihalobacterium alkalicellulosilyticum TaxID=1912214 RepID=UPI000996DB5D|nr:hypothetical protein [Bacillus alkalicellulosilyticus]
MLLRSINMQLTLILERKVATVIFFLLFGIMLANYFQNVLTYSGTDIVDMYHPMKLLTLSNYSEYSFYLMQYYPLLVVIPAGFALYNDKTLNQFIFIQARVNARNYYLGKIIVVFLVTFFVFTVPFLIEILLNIIAFPVNAVGDPSNFSIYDNSYIEIMSMYLLSDLYTLSPYLYATFFTLVFGVLSGILAIFTVAVSTFPIKFKALLFLPVYVLLYLLGMLKQLIPAISVETNYFFYLGFYHPISRASESLLVYLSLSIMLLVLATSIIVYQIKKDAL